MKRLRVILLSVTVALAGGGCGSATSSHPGSPSNATGQTASEGRGAATGSTQAPGGNEPSTSGGGAEDEIRSIFNGLWAAVARHDWPGVLAYLTPSEKAQFETYREGKTGQAFLAVIAPYHPSGVASISVDGESATLVAIEPSHTTNSVAFVKVGGAWRINGPPGGTPNG